MAERAKKPQRQTNKLAAVKLRQLRPGLRGDGGGLWLQVTPNRRGRMGSLYKTRIRRIFGVSRAMGKSRNAERES